MIIILKIKRLLLNVIFIKIEYYIFLIMNDKNATYTPLQTTKI